MSDDKMGEKIPSHNRTRTLTLFDIGKIQF